MKVYKNPFVNYPCYFVKTGARVAGSSSKGYCVELHNGKWICRNNSFYDETIEHELILVGENRKSIHSVIKEAVIGAVLELAKENLKDEID